MSCDHLLQDKDHLYFCPLHPENRFEDKNQVPCDPEDRKSCKAYKAGRRNRIWNNFSLQHRGSGRGVTATGAEINNSDKFRVK